MTCNDEITLMLISCKLLRGLVNEAQQEVEKMDDPSIGLSRIDDWKERYAAFEQAILDAEQREAKIQNEW